MAITVPFLDPCDSYTEDIKRKLVFLMCLQYHIYVHPEESVNFKALNLTSIHDMDNLALSDNSLVTLALVALGTGREKACILPQGQLSNPFQKSQYFTFWVAAEMMRRGRSNVPGLLQDMIQKFLTIWQTASEIKDVLCKFRIASSRERTRLQDIELVNNKILSGWDLADKRYWLPMVTYDNLGFRILGARAGYDQYVMILVHFTSVDMLKKVGFYTPKGQPSISRIRKSWRDIRQNYDKEDILPARKDYTCLGIQIYSQISMLMKLCDLIPSTEAAIQLLDDGDAFAVDTRVSTSYGTQSRLKHRTNTTSTEVEQEEEDEEDLEELHRMIRKPTMYDRPDQQVEVDIPMKADLNKTNTVKGLAKGALAMRDRFLLAGGIVDDTDEMPLLEDLGISTAGDGAPSNTFILQERMDPDAYKDIQNWAGGFHNLLNHQQKMGTRFGDPFLRDYLHPFRDTDKKKDWFLIPGDPNQTLLEQPEMTSAHYVMAMRNLSKIKKGAPISPVDVHNHMLSRALEHDHCMIVLLWLHHVAVTNIIRDSEHENDPDLYRIGCRLAALLYVKTHAPKYVRMYVYYFVNWECQSDADKVLHDNFYFTKKTADGKFAFIDRFEEWFNMDVREYLGKYKKPNQELLCICTALLMKERKQFRVGNGLVPIDQIDIIDHGDLEKNIAISPIFCHQLALIDRWNLWGKGSVLVGAKGKERIPDYFTDPTGRTALNSDILFEISSAQTTLKNYFDQTYLTGDLDDIGASEKQVSLAMTPIKILELEEEQQQELSRLTSTEYQELVDVTTVSFLKMRLEHLAEKYDYLQTSDIPKGQAKKEAFAKALALFHMAIRRKNTRFVSTIKKELKEKGRALKKFAESERKQKELDQLFFSLTDEAKSDFLHDTHTIKYHIEEEGDETDSHHSDDVGDAPPSPPATPTMPGGRPKAREEVDTPFVQKRLAGLSL